VAAGCSLLCDAAMRSVTPASGVRNQENTGKKISRPLTNGSNTATSIAVAPAFIWHCVVVVCWFEDEED